MIIPSTRLRLNAHFTNTSMPRRLLAKNLHRLSEYDGEDDNDDDDFIPTIAIEEKTIHLKWKKNLL